MSSWHTVAKVGDVESGRSTVVMVDGQQILLCNVDGAYYAIDDLCSHDYDSLGAGVLVGDQVECPRHGAMFDVKTGQAMTLPAFKPVATYPVRIEDDSVQVAVG